MYIQTYLVYSSADKYIHTSLVYSSADVYTHVLSL